MNTTAPLAQSLIHRAGPPRARFRPDSTETIRLGRDFPPHGLPARMAFGRHAAELRFLRPEDAPRLSAFFHSHTPETIRSRYGFQFSQMSTQRAAQLVGVDQTKDGALGIFEMDGKEQCLVAIGRCCRLPGGDAAEIAFVVREDRRRLGLATALFRALVNLMRRRGVVRLIAQVERDNEAMLGLFRQARATAAAIPGTDALEINLPIG